MRAYDWPPGAVRHFYIRRLFRIAPLFYAILVFTTVRDVLYFGAWHSAGEWTEKCPLRLHVIRHAPLAYRWDVTMPSTVIAVSVAALVSVL
jgi:peptidoglycan/LPS O-acetylase OafA/YrhL